MAFSSTASPNTVDSPPSRLLESDSTTCDFGAIYAQHERAIYYLTLRLLGDATRAEDAVHDVFLKAYRSLGDFRNASNVRTWLYRIAINHCQNLQKTWHQRYVTATDDAGVLDSAPHADCTLRVVEAKELGQRIQKALDALPVDYRLILLLIADEEMSYEEIGALTQQSADAVRGKLYRARKAFAQEFQKTA